MQLPVQVIFRNMVPSAAVEAEVRERAEKLERCSDRITSCRVAIEARHRRHRQGNLYHVRVDVKVPGAELVASREPAAQHAHEDVYVAVRDAFDAIRRRLEDHARERRGEVKRHEAPPHGSIVELYSDYGKIRTPEGRYVYFHRNSVPNGGFAKLAIGQEVRFVEEMGELGPQASTVQAVGKRRFAG